MQQFNAFLYKVDQNILNPFIYLLMTLGLVYFIYGVIEYVAHGDNEEGRTTGTRHMIWGIVGLFIMFGVFGIIHLILNTFGINDPNVNTIIH